LVDIRRLCVRQLASGDSPLVVNAEGGMPLAVVRAVSEISRFFGVVIAMFYSEHGVPHFHASYGDHRASIEVETGFVRRDLPRVVRLVLEWRALHTAELLENWQNARSGRPLTPVPPLE
jgi:hypothetical protein